MKTFLTATWSHLLNLSFAVPDALLLPLLPPELELDRWEGQAYVSLVAFDFLHTRVRGIKVPFHVNFPEVNLRFYVHHKGQRGVVFIREFVPKHCIALIAHRIYNEPYLAFPMESQHTQAEDGSLTLTHQIWKDKDELLLKARISGPEQLPGPDTAAHFFKEHELGFGRDKKGETLCYRVEHPLWATRDLQIEELALDFGKFYGPEWALLNGRTPEHALYCVGSPIKVFSAQRLHDLAAKS
jgi:uncharacterized protein